jgi:hypothetical protein
MGHPLLNFTWSTIQCISIEWYQERNTFMRYASVSTAQSSEQRLIAECLKTMIDRRRFNVISITRQIGSTSLFFFVKSEVELFISLTRKLVSKKGVLFHGMMICPFSKWRGLKILNFFENVNISPPLFFKRAAYFSEPRWTTHHQILQAARFNAYLLTDI